MYFAKNILLLFGQIRGRDFELTRPLERFSAHSQQQVLL